MASESPAMRPGALPASYPEVDSDSQFSIGLHWFCVMLSNGSAMNSRRTAKAARAIQETVSSTILLTLKDPRVRNVTVTRAEASGDLRQAKVYVSVMGDEKMQALTMRGLRAARGFLQSKVAERLQTKNTPILEFVLDASVKRSAEVSQAFREIDVPEGDVPEDEAENSAATDAAPLNDSSPDDFSAESADDELDDEDDSDDTHLHSDQ